MYRWVIPGRLAASRIPYPHEIPDLAKLFDSVVVLIEPHEYPGADIVSYLDLWRSYGAEVLWVPTRDWWPPHLLELYKITKWIDQRLAGGHTVLVHCMGGVGRSGTVIAGYFVYAKGYKPWEAIARTRKHIPGAAEMFRQEKMVEDLYYLLKNIPRIELDRILECAGKYDYGIGIKHASKVLQLSIELLSDLGYSKSWKPIILASIVHDILFDQDMHGLKASNLIQELADDLGIDDHTLKIASKIIKCHHPTWCSESDYDLETSIVMLADHLDHPYNQYVDYVELEYVNEGRYLLKVYCELDCTSNIAEASRVVTYFERSINAKVFIERYWSG